MPKRIDSLTDAQREAMRGHADAWIARALDCSEPDWEAWERGMRECYRFAGLEPPRVVVRVPNPVVGALAFPAAAHLIDEAGGDWHPGVTEALAGPVDGAVNELVGAVIGAVGDAVEGTVRTAVRRAVGEAVEGAVDGTIREVVGAVHGMIDAAVDRVVNPIGDAVEGAVGGTVDEAVNNAVGGAVNAVGGAVDGAVGAVVDSANCRSILDSWRWRIWGQWWAGSVYTSWASFFRDVCGLELPGDLWERSRAWEAANTVGWWWPHRDFVMVTERPRFIFREQVRPRGWGSHRLHREDGPAIAWEGWELYFWHGLRVPAEAFTEQGWLTVERITAEPNAELRRAYMEMLPGGQAEYIRAAGGELLDKVNEPAFPGLTDAELWRLENPDGGEELVCVLCRNSTPEPDGTFRRYSLWCHPELRPLLGGGEFGEPQEPTVLNALASTFGERGEGYAPGVET